MPKSVGASGVSSTPSARKPQSLGHSECLKYECVMHFNFLMEVCAQNVMPRWVANPGKAGEQRPGQASRKGYRLNPY